VKRLLVALLLVLAPVFTAAADEPVQAIVGGTLVNPGAVAVPDAVVLVRGGRIAAAGARGEVGIPADASRIDATGKWLVPGYIDSHVHFFQSGGLYSRPDVLDLRDVVPYEQEIANTQANLGDTFRRTLRSGVTTVVDMGGPMWNFDVRTQAMAAQAAPRVFVTGPLISTWKPPVLADLADPAILAAASAEEARALVRAQAPRKPDFIKIWYVVPHGETPDRYLPVVRAAIDQAHALGLRVAVHALELETARAAVLAGADMLVHSVEDKPVDAAFLGLLKKNGVVYIPTAASGESYERVFTRELGLTREEQAWGNPDVIDTLNDLWRLVPAELPGWLRQQWEQGRKPARPAIAMQNLKAVQDAGIVIATGTDAGNPGTLPGASYFRELDLMAEAGLTPAQILTNSTLGGARLLGRDDELGSIARGKFADIVILDADPLADVANFSRIVAVMKGGEYFPADSIIEGAPQASTRRNPQAFRQPGPEDQPEAVVQRQLEAYNAGDVEAFLATYSPEVELFTLGGERNSQGLEAMRATYASLFKANPDLKCEIGKRIVQGDYVIDHEHLTGLANGTAIDAVAIYEVKRGKIRRVWFTP